MKRTLVLTALDDEWQQIARCHRSTACLRTWETDHACFEGLGNLGQLVAAVRTADAERSTEMVWALLELAVDDQLATRTLLQIVVPGLGGELRWLVEWARRTDHRLLEGGDVDQLLIAAAMEAIRHASGRRKPWPVMSILRRAHRVLLRETGMEEDWRRVNALADPDHERSIRCEPSTDESLGGLLGEASRTGAVSRDDAALVWLTRVAGFQPAELEGRFAASSECLRRRRHRAEARLVRWAEAV